MLVDSLEVWRNVPPEEKFELMAKAQAQGVMAALLLIGIGCTVAVGLQIQAIMWVSLIGAPLVFQIASGKAWRDLRPKTMLEYLAVRSAARRYAFASQAKDLTLALVFRGYFMPEKNEGGPDISYGNNSENQSEPEPVWITLFNDALVIMRERLGGASLVFSHLLNDTLEIRATSPNSGKDYANDKQLLITYPLKGGMRASFQLTSRYPGALVVFEKKALALSKQQMARRAELAALADISESGSPPDAILDSIFDRQ